jgi:hypothetical protein
MLFYTLVLVVGGLNRRVVLSRDSTVLYCILQFQMNAVESHWERNGRHDSAVKSQ